MIRVPSDKRSLIAILSFALCLAGLSGLSSAQASTASPATAKKSTSFDDSNLRAQGYSLAKETKHASGTVTGTWKNGSSDVTITALPGARVMRQVNGKYEAVGVGAAARRKGSGKAAVQAYQKANRSPLTDAIDTGISRSEAQRRYQPLADEGDIIDSWCVEFNDAKAQIHGRGCDVRTLDQDNGGGDWYFADKMQGSMTSDDTSLWDANRLEELRLWMDYRNTPGDMVVQFNPISTETITNDSCVTVTASLTSNETGIGYSAQQTVCPDSHGPYLNEPRRFGSHWQGEQTDAGVWEGATAVTLVHNPPTAGLNNDLWIGGTWD